MQKKSFLNLLLPGLGYMVMGNLLATVMSFSLYSLAGNPTIVGMSVLFALAIYYLLVAVPAYKSGQEDSGKLKRANSEEPAPPKYKWLFVGVVLFAVMMIPTIMLMFNAINIGWYRLICGAINPLSGLIVRGAVPFVGIGVYVLTIPACHIGYVLGLGDKLSKENILYK
jgi:hypothetical protein